MDDRLFEEPTLPAPSQRLALDPVSEYLEWNDRIFERYFPIIDRSAVRILSFDDSELRAIAAEVGRSPEAFKESIRALVRHSGSDPFIWWRASSRGEMADRDPPYYVGLLALFSLAASQSGDTIDGRQRAYFHRQLGHLLGLDDTPYVPGFPEATSFYRELDEYLRVKCAGRRGRLLLASSTFGGRYVWRARVQVLLSASSRRQLVFFFEHRCNALVELTRSDIRALMLEELQAADDYAFSRALGQTLKLVHSESEELFEGFIDLIETEYVRWFLEREPAQEVLGSSHRPRSAERAYGSHRDVCDATNQVSEAPSRGGELESAPRRRAFRVRPVAAAIANASASEGRRRERKRYENRLILRAGIGTQPWSLSVQVRRIGEEGWQEVRSASFLWGESTLTYELADGTNGLITIDDLLTFANYGSGWIATSQLRAGDLCAILCTRQTAEAIREAFALMMGTDSLIRDCREAPQLAIVTARTPHADKESIPAALRDLLAPDRARVTFRRGLRLGPDYLLFAPPRVVFDHSTIECATVILDDEPLASPATRRKEYPLPSELADGLHVVEILGVRKPFRLTRSTVSSVMDPFDCAGFELCQARGIAIPVTNPGSANMNQYMNCRVIIVIGGLLL